MGVIDPAIKRRALGLLKSRPVKSYREVAEMFGVSVAAVYQWAKAAKIHKPDLRKHGVKADREREMTRLRRTHTLAEIGRKFGVSRQRVHQILKG